MSGTIARGPVHELIARLCRLQETINHEHLGHARPADCFCGEGGFWKETDSWPMPPGGGRWENDGKTVEFIEQAVVEKIAREQVAADISTWAHG